MHSVIPILLCCCLSAAVGSQGVPAGDAILSVSRNLPPSEGLGILAANGTFRHAPGLLAAGSAGAGVGAVRLDPVDDRIWIGGTDNGGDTRGQVNFVRLSSTGSVAQFAKHAFIGSLLTIEGITFDDQGNPIVVAGSATNGGGIYCIDRHTGAWTRLGSAPLDTHSGITRSPEGDLFVGTRDLNWFGYGGIYRMYRNPDCTYQPMALISTGILRQLSGLAWAPALQLGGRSVLALADRYLFEMPISGGRALFVSAELVDEIDYDRGQNRFVLATGAQVQAVSRDYLTTSWRTSLSGVGVEAISGIDVNDDVDNEITVLPACPRRATPITVEFGVRCKPGYIVALFLAGPRGPQPVLILSGQAPSHGRVWIKFERVVIPPWANFNVAAACYDPTTNRVTFSQGVAWP